MRRVTSAARRVKNSLFDSEPVPEASVPDVSPSREYRYNRSMSLL